MYLMISMRWCAPLLASTFFIAGALWIGTVVSSGGTLTSATISGGGVVEFKTSGSSTIAISSGTLILDDPLHFSGTVAGLADATQKIDLTDISEWLARKQINRSRFTYSTDQVGHSVRARVEFVSQGEADLFSDSFSGRVIA